MPVPGLMPRVVDPETPSTRRSAPSASCRSAASLMEGYDGLERFEIFTPDGWYRTGDLFHVDEDGFFYFHGRTRFDDQDRGATCRRSRSRRR